MGEAVASAQVDVSLSEESEGKASSSSPSSSSSSSAVAAPEKTETWSEWIEQKEYGTPNDWIDANPTAKQYQQAANEFFKGIGQWGHEKALAWFPTLYNYEEPTRSAPAQREEEATKTDLS